MAVAVAPGEPSSAALVTRHGTSGSLCDSRFFPGGTVICNTGSRSGRAQYVMRLSIRSRSDVRGDDYGAIGSSIALAAPGWR
jgi:hypothetical protein